MKRVRITYQGAFHHGMNRGINGEDIFSGNRNKAQFLDYLEEMSHKLKIRIFTYCIMENHYHLILENSSGRMSDFFRSLNGEYGKYYRKTNGGKGYVFQSRYNSTLIQNDSYLKMAIGYTLLNPVRAGIVADFNNYIWSSCRDYFSNETSAIVDSDFVNELFESKTELFKFLQSQLTKELPLIETKYGEILGEKEFIDEAVSRFDRRKRDFGKEMKRTSDRYFEPVEKVIWEFEKKVGQRIEDLEVSTLQGKRLRGALLVRLKDLGGLKYVEINDIPPFDNLKFASLPKLYKDAKQRLRKDKETKS